MRVLTMSYYEPTLVANIVKCTVCNDIIHSKHSRDFVTCSCGACFLDGGDSYSRWGGASTNTSVWSDAPFEVIRQHVQRGGRGKNGDQPLTWVPIGKMSDDWLSNTLDYMKLRNLENTDHYYYLEMEEKYREENDISVADD